MSRAKSLSMAEFCECFRLSHPNEVGCQFLTHSQNSAIDRDFARDIRLFSKQHSKHSLKIASGWPKIRNIRLSEKLGTRILETFAKNIIRSSKNSIHSCHRNVRRDQRPRHSSKKSSVQAKIRYIRVSQRPPKQKIRNIRQKYRSVEHKFDTFANFTRPKNTNFETFVKNIIQNSKNSRQSTNPDFANICLQKLAGKKTSKSVKPGFYRYRGLDERKF